MSRAVRRAWANTGRDWLVTLAVMSTRSLSLLTLTVTLVTASGCRAQTGCAYNPTDATHIDVREQAVSTPSSLPEPERRRGCG